ncbi:hypothetical protein HDV00_008107 [Rhizophlyctis rosea]|nr:hypothetical protein HDV00_008107 [Rhizophlyctis rosea]
MTGTTGQNGDGYRGGQHGGGKNVKVVAHGLGKFECTGKPGDETTFEESRVDVVKDVTQTGKSEVVMAAESESAVLGSMVRAVVPEEIVTDAGESELTRELREVSREAEIESLSLESKGHSEEEFEDDELVLGSESEGEQEVGCLKCGSFAGTRYLQVDGFRKERRILFDTAKGRVDEVLPCGDYTHEQVDVLVELCIIAAQQLKGMPLRKLCKILLGKVAKEDKKKAE